MYNAFIAFISVFLLGVVVYFTAWWQGADMGFKFTKWYFGIFFAAAVITGAYFYFVKG